MIVKRAARMSDDELKWYGMRMVLTLVGLESIFRFVVPVPRKLKGKYESAYKMKVVAIMHAVGASLGALYALLSDTELRAQTYEVITFGQNVTDLFISPVGASAARLLTSITTAFFIWELIHLPHWATSSKLDRTTMIAHHIISFALWPASCKNRIAHFFLIHFEFSEISSPFLQLRWVSRFFEWGPKADLIVSTLFASFFFFFRSTIMLPMLRAAWLTKPWSQATYPFLSRTECLLSAVSLPIPFLLNLLWTVQISLMILKTIRRSKKQTTKNNNKHATSGKKGSVLPNQSDQKIANGPSHQKAA